MQKGRAHPRDATRDLNADNEGKTLPAKNSNFPNRLSKVNKAQKGFAAKLTHDEGNDLLLEENTAGLSINYT